MASDLEKLRNQIDDIDDKIINLYLKRLEIVQDIATYKKNNKIDIFDISREKEKKKKNKIIVKQLLKKDSITYINSVDKLFDFIMSESKNFQNNLINDKKA